eukprot:4144157-Prymnesium_polylepis.1
MVTQEDTSRAPVSGSENAAAVAAAAPHRALSHTLAVAQPPAAQSAPQPHRTIPSHSLPFALASPPPAPSSAAARSSAATDAETRRLADPAASDGGSESAAPKGRQGRDVHVVVGADRVHWPGLIGVVHSIRANTGAPERIMLHLLTTTEQEAPFREFLKCHRIDPDEPSNGLDVVGFDKRMVPLLKVQTKLTNLESPLNFARFYMHRLFPTLHRALYVDADVIVQGDVAELFDRHMQHDELCAATFRKLTLGAKG